MKNIKGIILGILVAFFFQWPGEPLVALMGLSFGLSEDTIDFLKDVSVTLGVIMGILVYIHYKKLNKKIESV